ncbi:hypothetical protein VTP01DRAFT_3355 [Rhizomucor pusillus]|uniref:uncharacterized protein n=1 Tax=Rhizomucor pusillus TaxID=4840 RepID=UPI003742522F
MSNSTCSSLQYKQRVFSPVILFHDHEFVREGSSDPEHVHIPYRDPHYVQYIDYHRQRILQMLESNGRFWADVMVSCSKDSPSPVPSLVPSSPPPPAVAYSSSHHNSNDYSPTSSPLSPSPSSPSSSSISASGDTEYINSIHHHSGSSRSVAARRLRRSPRSAGSSAGRPPAAKSPAAVATKIGKKKQRSNLPKPVTAILKEWLFANKRHPYPNEDEKEALARQTGLARNQISNWFINARRRILIPVLAQDKQETGAPSIHRRQEPEFHPYMYNAPNDK